MSNAETLTKVREKAISYSHPGARITTMSDLDEITLTISKLMPHMITPETHLVLTLSKPNITVNEIVEKISACKEISSHIFKLARRSRTVEDFEIMLEKLREEVLLNSLFWDCYYQDSLIIYKVKQFKEQLT